ncbi:MAG TPA: THUMP domain-containing protein [Burkholderiaceae bacterium]|nr:THUMP domain-containing protein [Burkholderiaceae bacterium]
MPTAPTQHFFAICPRGLETLLADELAALDAQHITPDHGGVSFRGPLACAYQVNLHSRMASRVLWQVAQGGYSNSDDLYALAHDVRWNEHLRAGHSLRVDVTARASPLQSLHFATLKIKDGLVDQMREATGERPSIERATPDARVFAYLEAEQATLYLDLSGAPLFKRGWRRDKGEAPLKENLAAGLLRLSGWQPERPLLDPLCGSATLAIEAATMAIGQAPGLNRPFAFQKLLSFEQAPWQAALERAHQALRPNAECLIVGSDISTQVIDVARRNAQTAGLQALLADGRLRLTAADARHVLPPDGRTTGMIVSNPPYGEQSSPKSAPVSGLMRDFAQQLKTAFGGWEVWLLSADRKLPGQLRLQESRKIVLFNGPLECRLFRFDMVAGHYEKPRSHGAAADPQK